MAIHTEFWLDVTPHDRLYATRLRVILDRWGLITSEDAPLGSTDTGLAFVIKVEAYDDEGVSGVIASRLYEGQYSGQNDPYVVVKTIALHLFLSSQGEPLKEKELLPPEEPQSEAEPEA